MGSTFFHVGSFFKNIYFLLLIQNREEIVE